MEVFYVDSTERFLALGSGVIRTPGIHMTNMIRRVMEKMGTIKKAAGWSMDIAGEVGFIWEDLFSRVFADRFIVRLKEQKLDGILCSPDGLEADPGWDNGVHLPPNPDVLVLDEYKCTWRSSRKLPQDNWYWMAQAKGYCKVMGVDTVIMRILYLVGDWKGSGPQYREARITFTPREIDDNWNMILKEADEFIKEANCGN